MWRMLQNAISTITVMAVQGTVERSVQSTVDYDDRTADYNDNNFSIVRSSRSNDTTT